MKSIVSLVILVLCISVVFALPTAYNPWTGKLDFFGLEDNIRNLDDFSTQNLTVNTLETSNINLSGDYITVWNDLNAIVVNISDNDTFVSLNPKQGEALTWDDANTRYLNDYIQANYTQIDDKAGYFSSSTIEGALGQLANEIGSGTIPGSNESSEWQDSVLSITTYTPPVSPAHGDRYIIPYAVSGDWYTGWTYRQKINISSDYIVSNQTNFPVSLVIEDGANKLFTHAQADGDDIVFTSSDKKTKIPHELVYYNNDTGTEYAEIHINVPLVTSAVYTDIYMYYGNSTVSSQQNVTGVWDSDYDLVLHMQNLNSTYVNGSTGSDYGLLEDSPTETTGIMHNAQYFNGGTGGAWVNTSVDTNLSSGNFTVSAWVKDVDTANAYIISQAHTFSPYASDWIYGYKNGGAWMRTKTISGGDIVGDGDWHKLDMVFNSTDLKILIDGEQYGSSITPVGYGALGTVKLMTRGDAYASARKSGILDEIKISTTDRSDDYLNASYQNVENMADFFSLGSEDISSAIVSNWTGHENNITEWNSLITNWTFENPSTGWATIVTDEGLPYWWDGTEWLQLISGISHKQLNDLLGVDANSEGWHLTASQWTVATRLATNALSGLMPSGKMDYWDSGWHIGDIITQGLNIQETSPSIILEDSDDDTAYQIEYDAGSSDNLEIEKGTMNESEFEAISGSANIDVDGTVKSVSSVVTGSSYSGETIGGQANLVLYILSGTTARILPYDGSSYYDLAIGDWNSGNPNIMLKEGGNVGIGDGSPNNRLRVGGDGNFSGTVYINNATDISTYASTYNTTYNTWAYNQTYSGSTYNTTYNTWLPNYTEYSKYWYNMTYGGSTYNTTYNTWSYNQTIPAQAYADANMTIGVLQGILNATDVYSTYNSSYVPYTGATGNVGLGNNNLTVNGTTLIVDSDNGRVGIGVIPEQKFSVASKLLVTNVAGISNGVIQIDGTSTGYNMLGGYEFGSGWNWMLTGQNNQDQLALSLGSRVGRQLVISDTASWLNDFSHATQDNPTLFIHSVTPSATATDQWLSLVHNTTDGIIEVGKGNLFIDNDLNINGNLTISETIFPTGITTMQQPASTVVANEVWKVTNLKDDIYGGLLESWFGYNSTSIAMVINTGGTDVFSVNFFGGAITSKGGLTLGNIGDTNILLSPAGTNTGTLTWKEDENYLSSENILLRDNNALIFNRLDGRHNITGGVSSLDFNFKYAQIAFNTNKDIMLNSDVNISGDLNLASGTLNIEDLTVNDLIQAERIHINTDNNSILFADDSFGVPRVGIGTPTPVYALDVNGTVDIYADLYVGDDLLITDDIVSGGDVDLTSGSFRSNNVIASQFDTVQSVWAFKYQDGIGAGTNTGLYFDAVGGEVSFQYDGGNIWKANLFGTKFTHGAGFDVEMEFSPSGDNIGTFKWDEGANYFEVEDDVLFDEEVNFTKLVNVNSNFIVSGNLTTSDGGKLYSNATCTFLASPDGSTIQEVCDA